MSELLPCPFCGGEANTLHRPHVIDWRYSVGCNDDECRGFIGLSWLYKTEAEANAAWNSRAERTCKPTEEYCCQCGQDLVLCDIGIGSNGGAVELDPPILFNYCPNCGRKAVSE